MSGAIGQWGIMSEVPPVGSNKGLCWKQVKHQGRHVITSRADSAHWPHTSVLVWEEETCYLLSFGTLYIIDAWERIQCHEGSYREERTEESWFFTLRNFQDGSGMFVSQHTHHDRSTYRQQALQREGGLIPERVEGRLSEEILTEVMFKLGSEGGTEIGLVENKGKRGILHKR